MAGLGNLNIELSLDAVKFQQNLKRSEQQARLFANRTVDYLKNIENAANSINSATKVNLNWMRFDKFKSAALQIIDYTNKNTELANKLKLVTETELQHAKAMSDVYSISMKTAQSTQAVSSVYQTFAQNAKELGINQRQVAEMTEIISKAVSISGASASDAQNALTQFSQVLLMGKFRAQEYNSVMTQTPAVMQAISRGLGVTMGELKTMSDDGKLTSDKIIQGLQNAKRSVDELYGKTATTMSGAFQNLETATQKWTGELDKSLGISEKVIAGTEILARHLDEVAKMATVVGVAYASWKVGSLVQGKYNLITATKTENATRRENLTTLTQQTQATYTEQLAIYQNIQAKQADVVATQAQIQAERAKLQLQTLSATSYAERRLIQTELQALDRVSAELTQKQTFLDQQAIIAKQGLKAAYAENAVAQSAFAASTRTSSTAMLAYSGIVAGVRNEMNLLKAAMMANPIMFGLTVLSTAAAMMGMFGSSTEDAKEKALQFADAIDQARANLEQMTAVQISAELVKTKQSIKAQEEALAKLRQEQQKLINAEKEKIEVIYDELGVATKRVKSDKEIAETQDKLTLKTAEVEEAQSKLNKTLEWQRDLKAHEPVADLKEQFSALFPQVEQSQIKVDGLNVSIGNLTVTLPQATIEALKFAGAIGSIATGAIQAAVAVANLNNVSGGQLGETAQKMIRLNQIEGELSAAKKGNDKKRIAELEVERAELSGRYKDLQGKDLEAVKASDFEKYQRQAQEGFSKGSKKGRSGSKTKSSEDYRNDWDKYYDDLVNANATAWEKIRYEQEVAARELDKHLSHGVVSQAEAEKARALITEQYSKQRRELAGQYAPEIAAQEQLKQQLQDITQLRENEALTAIQAIKAREKAQYDYAQNVAQNAVNPLAQFNAQFDPYQEIENQRTRDLALLDAMQDSNGQKLLAEEDYQQKRQQIIDKYDLERQKKEADYYTQSTQMMSSAFDTMAGVMENAAGQQSAAYKAMFAVSKAFAIAEASIKLSQAISQAMADPTALTPVQKFANMAAIASAGANLVSQITSIGFSSGGYTGDGGKYVPAGIVHKGEYVITKEATARLGKGYLDYLNYGTRGFASGGGVAVPNVPMPNVSSSGASSNQVSININIDQNGNTESQTDTTEQAKQLGKTIEAKVLEVLVKQHRAGGMLS